MSSNKQHTTPKVIIDSSSLINNYLKGDKTIWFVILLLSLFSVLAVYSATGTLAYKNGANTEYYLIKQMGLLGFGFVLMYLVHLVNFKYFSRIAQLLFWASLVLLPLTLLVGNEVNDARRWLTLPGLKLTFQTSDLAKLALIMYLARVLSKKQAHIKSFQEAFWPTLFPVILICGLIAPEDLSTAVVLFSTSVLVMFIGRINLLHIGGLIGISGLLIGFFVIFLLNTPDEKLRSMGGRFETAKGRIEAFTGGEEGIPFQAKQAQIAIARGGFFPNGPGNSTQKNILPNPYADYIYAIIIEEYGLLGGAFITILYLVLLWRSITFVMKSPKAFGAILGVGLTISLVIQAFINMGVAVGLLPVTGLTLPLVSMGGTSTMFTSIALGIILSVSRSVEKEQSKVSVQIDDMEEDSETEFAMR